jgi:opacity protein-like surface antigen
MQRLLFVFAFAAALAFPAHAQSTSCAVGGHGSSVNADVGVSGIPATIGSDGYMAGGRLSCELQSDQIFGGGMLDYSRVFGDLNKLGVDTELAGALYVGFKLTDKAGVYALGGKSKTYASGFDLDAWQVGGGIRAQVGDTPWEVFAEYRKSFFEDVPAPLDLTADTVRAGAQYRFNLTK